MTILRPTPDIPAEDSAEPGPGLTWFCAKTDPHGEKRAEMWLVRKGYETALPYLKRHTKIRNKKRTVLEKLFVGYLFIGLRQDQCPQAFYDIGSTIGIRGILGDHGMPKPIPASFMASLLGACRRDEGRLICAEWQAVTEAEPAIKAGATVRIIHGPFQGFPASVLRMNARDRVKVLTALFGSEVPLELEIEDVELMDEPEPQRNPGRRKQRKKRTRREIAGRMAAQA